MVDGGGPYPHNPTMRAISAEERRTIVASLLDEVSPVTERDLANRLSIEGAGPVVPRTPNRGTRRVLLDLVHHHLPVLADADLVDRDRDAATVERGSHPALDDPRFRSLLTIDAEDVDAVLTGLSHDHRRTALAVLRDAPGSVATADLASAVHRQVPEVTGRHPASVDDLRVSLRHGHLPKLDEADLVEYDPEAGRATYSEHPTLERVFRIVFGPDERIADRYDAFLGGLHDSYETVSRDASEVPTWPHYWRDPSRG